MSSDLSLREASSDELEELCTKTEKYLPASIVVHSFLKWGFNAGGSFEGTKAKVFIPNQSLEVFVIITGINEKDSRQSITAFWDTKLVTRETAHSLLSTVPNFNWTEMTFQYACYAPVSLEISQFMSSKIGVENATVVIGAETNLFTYTKEVVRGKRDHAIRRVPKSLIPTIYKYWDHNEVRSIADVERMIERLPSSAIYIDKGTQQNIGTGTQENIGTGTQKNIGTAGTQSQYTGTQKNIGAGTQKDIGTGTQENIGAGTQENIGAGTQENIGAGTQENIGAGTQENIGAGTQENPDNTAKAVAWVLARDGGELGMTFSLPEHRNKGFAAKVTLDLVAQLQDIGMVPYSQVIVNNKPAMKLHEKIGFDRTGDTFQWGMYLPNGSKVKDF